MNERIKELSEQARQYAESKMHLTGVKDSAAYDEKFAELIVAECTKILADNSEFRGCVIISKHFGVEE